MTAVHERKLHPLPIRITHWVNAIAIFIMVGSGWKIYDDEPIFGWLQFADAITIGKWAQHGLQWHFLGMWIFVINGLAYLSYGIATGRYRRMLLPLHLHDLVVAIKDALHFKLSHDDTTKYNAVQKLLYIAVICMGLLMVVSGLTLWKPIQFSPLLSLFGSFQNVRLVHFFCMAGIVGFVVIHITLALLIPKTIVAMVGGGPLVHDDTVDQDRPARTELAG